MSPGIPGPAAPVRRGESVLPAALGVGCDHLDCPAPALHRIDVLDQDFYFCHHHWVEVGPALGKGDWRDGLEDARGPGGTALPRALRTATVPVV